MKKQPKVPITILFQKEQVEALDFLTRTGEFASRGHATRMAVQNLIDSRKEKLQKFMEEK